MKHTGKLLSVLLTLAMLAGLLPWGVLPARAEGGAAHWSGVVSVTEDTTLSLGAVLDADTTLTVAKKVTLTVNGGVDCGGYTLTVSGTGSVVVNGDTGGAGVSGDVTLTGGTMTVAGGSGGSGEDEDCNGGTGVSGAVTVIGGTMTVTGGNGGDGDRNNRGGVGVAGDVKLSGGTMTVTGGNGGGNDDTGYDNNGGDGICGKVELNGGALTASGGAGENGGVGVCGDVTLSGGTLTANGGDGNDEDCNGGDGIEGAVTLSGGALTANGGAGKDNNGIEGAVTLTGGMLTANGGDGADNNGIKGDVTLSGGMLTANGGEDGDGVYGDIVELSGGVLTANGGAGGGTGVCGSVTQSGGVLIAAGGDSTEGWSGGGIYSGGSGSVTLTGGVLIAAGGNSAQSWGGDGVSGAVTLGGGAMKASGGTGDSDEHAGYAITGGDVVADGRTYKIDGEGSYTGTLNDDAKAAAAGKWLATGCQTGDCGARDDIVDWALVENGGTVTVGGAEAAACTLLIDGTGDMKSYSYGSEPPWADASARITDVVFGGAVKNAGQEAFRGCSELRSVYILSEALNDLGAGSDTLNMSGFAFSGCAKLESICVAGGNEAYAGVDGALYKKDTQEDNSLHALLFCPYGKTGTLAVPAGVKSFAVGSFCGGDDGPYTSLSEIRVQCDASGSCRISFGVSSENGVSYVFGANYTGKCRFVAAEGTKFRLQGDHFPRFELALTDVAETSLNLAAATEWDRLQEQFANGGTVTLDRDWSYAACGSDDGMLFVPAGTVIDLNGHALTAAAILVLQDESGADLTLQNGSVNSAVGNYGEFSAKEGYEPRLGTLTARSAVIESPDNLGVGMSVFWYGAIDLTNSTMTENTLFLWMLPESGTALRADAESSLTLTQIDLSPMIGIEEALYAFSLQYWGGDYQEILGGSLPDGCEFVSQTVGSEEGGYSTLVAVRDGDGAYPETVTLTVPAACGVVGDLTGGTLAAAVTLPADANAVLIAASYDGAGRQAGVEIIELKADQTAYETGLAGTDGNTYKLMLVDKDAWTPLCAAWEG